LISGKIEVNLDSDFFGVETLKWQNSEENMTHHESIRSLSHPGKTCISYGIYTPVMWGGNEKSPRLGYTIVLGSKECHLVQGILGH